MAREAECDRLVAAVRAGLPNTGLLALGAFVTAGPCYLASGSVALRGSDCAPVRDAAGNPLAVTRVIRDPGLASLGVEVVTVAGAADPPGAAAAARIGGLLWQAGVLLQILDRAHAHLSGRTSGGQKTLRHQLVKTAFTDAFSLVERTRGEAPMLLDTPVPSAIDDLSDRLGAVTTRAAKLMGGHGYLGGSVNALECLSLCGAALMRVPAEHTARAAA